MSPSAPPDSARPLCPHQCVFLGLYGEVLHMVCGCKPTQADEAVHARLRAAGWFQPYDAATKLACATG